MSPLGFVAAVFLEAWGFLVESAPYLLFGFGAAGMLHGFLSTQTVARHLGSGGIGPVVKAALLGIPLPLCCCGTLPAAMGLRRKGASKGATVAFLVATPETGVDSIALTYALFDPLLTVFRPLAAFVTAVVAGVVETRFGRQDGPVPTAPPPADCGCQEESRVPAGHPGGRVREGLRYAFGDLLRDLAPWLAVGFLLAGLIAAAMPEDFIGRHLGQGLVPLLAMLAAGVPLYVCATSSTPIAAALVLKGLSPGAALVFLLAGPATNLASLTALWGSIGAAATARYLAVICAVALGMGALLDQIYLSWGKPLHAVAGTAGEVFPHGWGVACALLLLVLGLRLFLPLSRRRAACSGPS